MGQWIGDGYEGEYQIGQIGFLLRSVNYNNGCVERYSLADRPGITNQSHEPRLRGWLGTTCNVALYAEGMAKVVKLARNGRALVAPLQGADLAVALDELGYPDLAEGGVDHE